MKVEIFENTDALAASLVRQTERAAQFAIAERGAFNCALTGGSAAKLLYPALAKASIEWRHVHFYFGDERCVPHTHPDSNYALALETLGATGAVFHPVDTSLDAAGAAASYERGLPPSIDVVHLGLGPDGHVCSLFAGDAVLHEHSRRVAAVTNSPKPPAHRVTLTLVALNHAKSLWFLVYGEAKADAVRAAIDDSDSSLPAALAHRGNTHSQWFLDRPAASLLKPRLSLE